MTEQANLGGATISRFEGAERIVQLLQQLGLEQAHVAARLDTDWTDLVAHHPELITSLTLIYPWGDLDADLLRPVASRLLVVDDAYPPETQAAQVIAQLPGVTRATLSGYAATYGVEDIVADRPDAIGTAMLDFVAQLEAAQLSTKTIALPQGIGECAGITYHIRGSGPPLVLLPLVLAPSQWEPVLPMLSAHFCTITLSGAQVGIVSMLEARGRSDYLRVVRNVLEEVSFRPGGRILEVGCGSGVLSRWLAQRTARANPITGMDLNRYLLHEAESLATTAGVSDIIEFREGNAEDLPFTDNSFHVAMACTVLEEGDANRMLAEMVRVTEPGGHIAIIVRAVDMPWLVNLNIRSELKAKVEAPVGSVAQGACADSSLYRRMRDAGLVQRRMLPQLAALIAPFSSYYLNRLEASLSGEERHEWRAAIAQAEGEGTLFIAQPFHGALGTKPS
jgi:ubiquinone/menaquinone biosynthesis C-methylase UbiE